MDWPSISIVAVAYNRRDAVRTTLQKMREADAAYGGDIDVIVVDNASSDGTADMLREEFPEVQLIARDENIGAPAWNDGFERATGDWVLILDDDCYVPPDALPKAMVAARDHGADMVSFRVVSTLDESWVFSDKYRTGLFTFWGCACLVRTSVIHELGGYDREMFIWGNELEFSMRFYDRGYRHLHLPEVTALHMKPPGTGEEVIDIGGYLINARHWGYIVGKLMRPRDAAEALVALIVRCVRDAVRVDWDALRGIPATVRGFAHGVRLRQALRNPELSRFYRRNFETFASPWWLARPVTDLVRGLPGEGIRGERGEGRREQFYAERSRYYPRERAASMEFRPGLKEPV